ncbi:MAG: DivIVA domain-containing protein [Solirubrobacteraceae bacterium]
MALDRQTIEKRDFPIGRRGYEPAAVDAHLTAIAREVEKLKRTQGSAPAAVGAPPATGAPRESLASVASAQVQAIVEAAESSAASIEREAQENADQIAQDAAREAQRIRDEAIERSQDHVGKVHEATALMLQRVDAMESELGSLVESLRTGANRLSADLSLLSGNMGELYAAAGQPESGAAPIVEGVVIVEDAELAEFDADEPELAPEPVAVEPDDELYDEPEPEPAAEPAVPDTNDDDIEGARLIALNMALNGQSRDETDKYLAENFDLSDRAGLLDEVYATVEG